MLQAAQSTVTTTFKYSAAKHAPMKSEAAKAEGYS